jgi:hypothetical protein
VVPPLGIGLYKVVPFRRFGGFVGSICADRGVSVEGRMDRAVRYARSDGMTLGSRLMENVALA